MQALRDLLTDLLLALTVTVLGVSACVWYVAYISGVVLWETGKLVFERLIRVPRDLFSPPSPPPTRD
jgi:hypothetical protein